MFRLGRLRFRVREVFLGKNKQTIEYQEGRIKHGKAFGGGQDVTHKKVVGEVEGDGSNPYLLCRICLEGEKPGMEYADVCGCTRTMP